jgi:hypothetical protein
VAYQDEVTVTVTMQRSAVSKELTFTVAVAVTVTEKRSTVQEEVTVTISFRV